VIARSHEFPAQSTLARGELRSRRPTRGRTPAVAAHAAPWRDPGLMSPKERLLELAALLAAAYARAKGLDAVSRGEPSCVRPRAAGAARARRGYMTREERTP
jgi:hypothetical protein